jgi:hypothetical protein
MQSSVETGHMVVHVCGHALCVHWAAATRPRDASEHTALALIYAITTQRVCVRACY